MKQAGIGGGGKERRPVSQAKTDLGRRGTNVKIQKAGLLRPGPQDTFCHQ